jgi:hypothetical protein
LAGLGKSEVSEKAVLSPEGRVVYAKGKDETEFPEVISDRGGSYKSGIKTVAVPQLVLY